MASTLHQLTRKEVKSSWTKECQDAFDLLKGKLLSSPVFDFVLETDASAKGQDSLVYDR